MLPLFPWVELAVCPRLWELKAHSVTAATRGSSEGWVPFQGWYYLAQATQQDEGLALWLRH